MTARALADEPYVSITSYKRDGTPVSTPVWCVGDNGSLLVVSEANAGKVKRIRQNRHVRVTPCSARGKPRGEIAEADAEVTEETTRVETLLASKYGWRWRGYGLLMTATRRIRRQADPGSVTIRIIPR